MADDFGLPGNLRIHAEDFEADFHGAVENAVHGGLDGENRADGRRLVKADVIDGDCRDFSFSVGVGGDAGGLV